jgi:hypothetical protein
MHSRSTAVALVVACATTVAACGELPRPNLTALRQQPRDALSVTVVDETGWVQELAIEDPSDFDSNFRVVNAEASNEVLIVRWIGGLCADPPVDAVIGLTPRGDRVSLTLLERRTLQSCMNGVGIGRQVELRLDRPLPAVIIDAEHLFDQPGSR